MIKEKINDFQEFINRNSHITEIDTDSSFVDFQEIITKHKQDISQLIEQKIKFNLKNNKQYIDELKEDFEQQKAFTKNSFDNFREIIAKLYEHNQSNLENNRNINNKVDSYYNQTLNIKEKLEKIINSLDQYKKFTENSLSYFQELINKQADELEKLGKNNSYNNHNSEKVNDFIKEVEALLKEQKILIQNSFSDLEKKMNHEISIILNSSKKTNKSKKIKQDDWFKDFGKTINDGIESVGKSIHDGFDSFDKDTK
ncbi:hypothetical protein [Cyanothece sp. BG0011]|uniref:hypothetical protein n=1 Tax=Cyanothece sp. BG0011 TaxID=2082950 RepID=UPI000D1EEC97|nr:hypothetical protein [Cyanothece sp. BG0011]